jgi:hypothetical protein
MLHTAQSLKPEPYFRLGDFDAASSSVEYLQKPFALQTLLERLGEMIAGRERLH